MLAQRHAHSEPGPDDRPTFAIRADLTTGWVHLAGRLDGSTAHLLHDALSTLLDDRHTRWNLDLAELTGADEAGLRAVDAAYRRATRHGREFTLHGASPALQKALTRLSLDRRLLAARPLPAEAEPPRPPTPPDAA